MKIYEVTIKPLSDFATPLKGDTLFGHICWQAAYDEKLFSMSIDEVLQDYKQNPFVVISSAYPKLGRLTALKRPDMPLDALFDFSGKNVKEIIRKRKQLKKKRWMLIEEVKTFFHLDRMEYIDDGELFETARKVVTSETAREIQKKGIKSFTLTFSRQHNTINRLTGTTGEGMFTPFSINHNAFMPETELVLFVGIDEKIGIEQIEIALKRIGEFGFGKDASTGLGRFEICDVSEVDLCSRGNTQSNACYTLSPCVPEKEMYKKMFFTPFIRFGRHGDVLAKSSKPFKNPVIMADEGAVFIPKNLDVFKKPYLGSSITNISKVEPKTVMQGYSLYIPIKVEV